jgi:hypothetical protein
MRRLLFASLLASSTMFGYVRLSALNPFSHGHDKHSSYHSKTQETAKHTKHQHHKKGLGSQATLHAARVS